MYVKIIVVYLNITNNINNIKTNNMIYKTELTQEVKELKRKIISTRISINVLNKNLTLDNISKRTLLLHSLQVRVQRLSALTELNSYASVSPYKFLN